MNHKTMRILTSIIFLLFCKTSFGQTYGKNKSLGCKPRLLINQKTGKEITADAFEMPDNISKISFDSINNRLYLLTKIDYDPLKEQSHRRLYSVNLSTKKYDYYRGFNDDLLVKTNEKYTVSINGKYNEVSRNYDNSVVLKTKKFIYDIYGDLALAYDDLESDDDSTLLYGIDINTGEEKWSTTVSKFWAQKAVVGLDDSTFLIQSNGLYFFNVNRGLLHHDLRETRFKTTSKKTEDSIYLLANRMRDFIAFTDRRASYFIPTKPFQENRKWPSGDQIENWMRYTSLHSNILIENGLIYFACTEYLTCSDFSGTRLWTYNLPDKYNGMMQLRKVGNYLALLNIGLGMAYGKTLPLGKPFLLTCKDDGTNVKVKNINAKEAKLMGAIDDYLFYVQDDKITMEHLDLDPYKNFVPTGKRGDSLLFLVKNRQKYVDNGKVMQKDTAIDQHLRNFCGLHKGSNTRTSFSIFNKELFDIKQTSKACKTYTNDNGDLVIADSSNAVLIKTKSSNAFINENFVILFNDKFIVFFGTKALQE